VTGTIIFFNVKKMKDSADTVATLQKTISDFRKMGALLVDVETGLRGYLVSGDAKFLQDFDAGKDEFEGAFLFARKAVSEDTFLTDKLDRIYQLKNEWMDGPIASLLEARKKYSEGTLSRAEFETLARDNKSKSFMDSIRAETEAVVQHEEELLAKQDSLDDAIERSTFLLLSLGLGASVAIGAVFCLIVARNASKKIVKIADELSSGAFAMTASSSEVSESAQRLSSSTTTSASSLEETVASIEELTSMVGQNAHNSKLADAAAAQSRSAAETGESEIRQLLASIDDIATSSKKIEAIIGVIDNIAFQTNLLALNAAVEAARAGEQGKGFAVVADAVRTLAQRSSDAAKDSTSLIKECVDKSNYGQELAKRSGAVLQQIVQDAKKVSTLVSEISSASNEQAAGLQQISRAMNQLDQSVQTNASSASEMFASGQSLETHAHSIARLTLALHEIVSASEPKALIEAPEVQASSSLAASSKTRLLTPVASSRSLSTASKAKSGAELIPFEKEEASRRVGTTDGF
jgi:methyl-accepting chemotaxis protein